MQAGGAGEDTGGSGAAGWLRGTTQESLADINELCLSLMAAQAGVRSGAAGALGRVVAELWPAMDAAARQRAASCPYLLIDAGFADPGRWRTAAGWQVRDAARGADGGFFIGAPAVTLARLVFTFGWHLSRTDTAAARLLLGMAPQSATAIGRCTLRQIEVLAEAHPHWLRPRWSGQSAAWRELLLAATADEASALQRARLRGLALLAGEARRAMVSQGRVVGAPVLPDRY
ncbi:MAG: hypothetical protein JSR67_16360 [Proteobacteria bacterium]|nr:hypothetical protein [Pseudomonadota bacterium]